MGRLRLVCAAACIFVNEAKERKKMADCKKVAVIMGSDSDFPTVSGAVKTLSLIHICGGRPKSRPSRNFSGGVR